MASNFSSLQHRHPERKSGLRHSARLMACLFAVAMLLSACGFTMLTPSHFLSFDFKGTNAILTHSGTSRTIDLQPFMGAHTNFEFHVLLANRVGETLYSVIETSGELGQGGNANCANGVERNVIWFKLDSGLNLLDQKSVLIESCTENIRCPNKCEVASNSVTAHFTRSRFQQDNTTLTTGWKDYTLHYDNTHPELGLVVETNLTASK